MNDFTNLYEFLDLPEYLEEEDLSEFDNINLEFEDEFN